MIIRKPIKLKVYRLSYLYTHESYNKIKNFLLLQNLTTNYELQKKKKLNRNSDINLTETKYKNDISSKKSLTKSNIKINNLSLKNSINNIFMSHKSYFNKNKTNEKDKNIFNQKNKNFGLLPKLKGTKEKKFSLSLFEREKKKQRNIYKEKLREKLFELEACEKKFDVEINNTLSKLNEEEKKFNKI